MNFLKCLGLLLLCGGGAAHEISQLQVPLYADPRRAAELSCRFTMHQQRLHSVKWYRDTDEIFRYSPSQKTPIRLFNVSGAWVQAGACAGARCVLRLTPRPPAARAAFTCEVSTEGPRFLIARETKHMTVVALPESGPVIAGAPAEAAAGAPLLLNCSAGPSLPPADILWYLDDRLQEGEPWSRTQLGAAGPHGLRAAWRVLAARAPGGRRALHVRCEAVLRVDPPVRRDAAAVVRVRPAARLSKYVASRGAARGPARALLVAGAVAAGAVAAGAAAAAAGAVAAGGLRLTRL